ncbi:MAG: nitroreductase family protein [Chitinispirillaceae bacterium]|nr:nitroreductase family protein [Chitinispirillaceae bacterium]
MSFYELAHSRFSVRKYKSLPVEEETLEELFKAVALAPSACNIQPWVFIVLRDEQSRLSFRTVYPREWFYSAPVIIAACCDHDRSWKRNDGKDFGEIDVAIALDHLTLVAAERGLGTCWVGNFNVETACRVLRLPANVAPVALTPLGYPVATTNPEKVRKEISEFVFEGYFGGKRTT